jgi:hypothetical protein
MNDKPRKAIQISCTDRIIVALCDDGSIWGIQIIHGEPVGLYRWREYPSIPEGGDVRKMED